MSEDRLKIAVFIDFDNIEIGVKTTLGQHFDVGAVLEAIKERGEIVTKVAYGDWTRAGEYGRAMSQHAIHMVQRNLTPGGDKNGADINLALDALEMAFTHNHINSFVIVGGDSDFISLVEKLKQYDRKVFVVGGRAFTSVVMQKNCTEFVAYENLVGRGRAAPRGAKVTAGGDLAQAMPLVRRALKLLADREVLPQLGLLKSTLLQLDSAFSERDYGASSFRDFVQKLANAGFVALKGSDRSFHVELRESGEREPAQSVVTPPPGPAAHGGNGDAPALEEPAASEAKTPPVEILRVFQNAVQQAKAAPRWPLYVRQVKQLVKAVEPQFDERSYGFGGIIDALRYAQRESLFRIERDRLGVVRVFPGPALQKGTGAPESVAEPTALPELLAHAEADISVDDAHVEDTASPETSDGEAAHASEAMPPITAGDAEMSATVMASMSESEQPLSGAEPEGSEPGGGEHQPVPDDGEQPALFAQAEPGTPQRRGRGRSGTGQPRARKNTATATGARKRSAGQGGRGRRKTQA